MENTWSRNIMNSSGWRKNLASLKPSVLYKAVHSTCSFFTLDILKHHFSTVVEDRFQETGLEGKKKGVKMIILTLLPERISVSKYKNEPFSYLEDSRVKLEVEVDMVVEDMLKLPDTVQEDKLQLVVGDTLMVDKLN